MCVIRSDCTVKYKQSISTRLRHRPCHAMPSETPRSPHSLPARLMTFIGLVMVLNQQDTISLFLSSHFIAPP